MSSHRAAAIAPLPQSDDEDSDSRQYSGDHRQSASGTRNTNNRSWPEFQVASSINSNRREMRSTQKRSPRHDFRHDERQQSPRQYQSQEEALRLPKENKQNDPEHSSFNPYRRGADRSGQSYQKDSVLTDSSFADKQPYYRPPAARREKRASFSGEEDAPVSSSNYQKNPYGGERKRHEQSSDNSRNGAYSLAPPRHDKKWGSSPEQSKQSKNEQRNSEWYKSQSSVGTNNPYMNAYNSVEPQETNSGRMTSWKDSYSTMQAVPLPGRQQPVNYVGANSSRRNSSESDNRDRSSRNSKGSTGERKLLKAPTSNPYASKRMKSFTDIRIPKIFIKALTDMDFVQPTQIQAHALPLILDRDRPSVMGHAKAGSGKTAAFGIGMLYWSSTKNERCEALAICPTRELAIQVHEVVVRLAKFTQHGVFLAVPGCDNRSRITDAVVIGTPGKIYYDLLGGEGLRKQQPRRKRGPLIDPEHVRILVIDEADCLLTKQHGLSDIVLKCRQMLPPDIQVLCFSATFDGEAREFVNVVAPKATLVEVQPSKQEQEAGKRIPGGINSLKIKHIMAKCNGEHHKYECLSDMFGYFNIGQGLIFVQTTDNANRLSRQLSDEGYQVGIIHGKMPKAMRDAVMEDFRAGRSTHLISSNLLARGIDIPNISVVINYDVPIGKHVDQYGRSSWGPDVDVYIHRAGRTGRFGRNGACITLIHDQASFEKFSIITNRLEIDYGLKIKQIDAESLETIEEDVNSHLAS